MGRHKFAARKTEVCGIVFDSAQEAQYYLILKSNPSIKQIKLKPSFQIINPYIVECKRCSGCGQTFNGKTKNFNKCKLCKGNGKREKSGAVYTADFHVVYLDGLEEVIDVKGYGASRDFTLRKKLFEILTGKELVIVRNDRKKGWIRE